MDAKRYRFFYHYNKPLSQQKKKPVISVHYRKQCLFADNVIVNVKTRGRINKRQPRFVVTGKAKSITIRKGIAYIE